MVAVFALFEKWTLSYHNRCLCMGLKFYLASHNQNSLHTCIAMGKASHTYKVLSNWNSFRVHRYSELFPALILSTRFWVDSLDLERLQRKDIEMVVNNKFSQLPP